MYRELATQPKPTPRSWWQRQNWACRLGLHALKTKLFKYRYDVELRNKLDALRWWNRAKWESSWTAFADRTYARCTRHGCNYAVIAYEVGYPNINHKERLTNENQLPPSLRRKKLLR